MIGSLGNVYMRIDHAHVRLHDNQCAVLVEKLLHEIFYVFMLFEVGFAMQEYNLFAESCEVGNEESCPLKGQICSLRQIEWWTCQFIWILQVKIQTRTRNRARALNMPTKRVRTMV